MINYLVFAYIIQSVVRGSLESDMLNTKAPLYPNIIDDIRNISVIAGREAVLSCVVENLNNYRVGWLKVDSQTILSLQKRVVTHNNRVSVTHDEHRTWNLHIKHVRKSDSGCYMCQLNTPVMKSRVGCLDVYVPPNIIDNETSSETTVHEGENTTFTCKAEGYPDPEIRWKREKKPIFSQMSHSSKTFHNWKDEVRGNDFILTDISREQMGAYYCIASNGVPPIVSKRIQLNVNFAPMVYVQNQLFGAPLMSTVKVVCNVEAYPRAVNYWKKNNDMVLKGQKYEIMEKSKDYKTTLQLEIRNFSNADEGMYKCLSSNSLGKAETSIRIYVINMPKTTDSTKKINEKSSDQSKKATRKTDRNDKKNHLPINNFNQYSTVNMKPNLYVPQTKKTPSNTNLNQTKTFNFPGLDIIIRNSAHKILVVTNPFLICLSLCKIFILTI